MDKEEKCLAAWEKMKSKGLFSYIVKMGIFYYGLTYFLTWVFLVPLIDNNFQFNFIHKETFKTRCIIFGIVSPLYGIFFSYTGWKACERKYE